MSDEVKDLVPQPETVSEYEKRRSIEWAINSLAEKEGDSFIGPVLQCLSIGYNNNVPTLGVMFNKKTRVFELHINPIFFCKTLNDLQRVAVLKHEVMHILNKHVYFDCDVLGWDRIQANVAMDVVINQYIKNLPEGCITLDKFTDSVGVPLKSLMNTEYYYNAIQQDAKFNKGKGKDGQGKGKKQEGSGQSEGTGQGQGQGTEWVKAKDHFKSNEQAFDIHGWQEAGLEPSEILDATSDLIKRAMQKVNYDYSKIPSSIKDLLDDIEKRIKGLNYKAIINSALRKSLPTANKRLTWRKPSRRYGEEAKGRVKALMPRIEVFIDTSGSISMEEANEFLDITRNFLTVGVEEAHVNMFHTSNYFRQKMKKNFKISKDSFQSGGTDLTSSMQLLLKQKCDLAIVVTDGYFDIPSVDLKRLPQMVFVISKGGKLNHPMANCGPSMFYKP